MFFQIELWVNSSLGLSPRSMTPSNASFSKYSRFVSPIKFVIQTKHLINKAVFNKMKDSSLFINTSRGGIVNEKDLIEALKNGDISGACLDVFESEPLPLDSELRNMENVILTPHTAGMPDGRKFHKKRYDFFITNIKRVENGEEPESKLNQIL
ncbi:NAD(P)-dependent oxidoreductase [Paenibacillus sp. RRE4]|uniref:NAD(P)-dependent oxidoreductase n=1 Tax=Paenibacillus sp. RRE4 TaxID=2962587 RepID=UPI00288BD0F9|nr:NAD(P)-dependent oxidoreductase [Paenibacillus sp. RRE4]